MILWTIQSLDAWRTLQDTGILHTDPNLAEQGFLKPYGWLADRMVERVGSPPAGASLPLWAWYRWEGAGRPRPDLRSGGLGTPGSMKVRIEFEIADDAVVLSDFDLWHCPLNYWYIAKDEAASEAFEAELKKRGLNFFEQKPLPVAKYHRRIVESWLWIFDLAWDSDWFTHADHDKKCIQATFWELRLEMVRETKEFRAR